MSPELRRRMGARLAFVYGDEAAAGVRSELEALVASYRGRIPVRAAGWSERDALLIAYGDTLRGDAPPLRVLHGFLKARAADLVTFVHLLPFYPSSSDDGFAVIDFRQVNPALGAWDDVRALAGDFRLVFDGVVNHVSAQSRYVTEYLAGNPAFADFCLALPPDADTASVLRTRNLPLLHAFAAHDGTRHLWTTFSRDQVDLNFANPRVLLEIADVLLFYAAQGMSMVRLDAIPYLWKQLGTSCAHRPQTHALIRLFRDLFDAAAPHVLQLTETNVPHRENVTYFGDRGDEAQMIYNFALPPLILWSLHRGDATALSDWARGVGRVGPAATYLNITATHDGIGMRPTEGLLGEAERSELVRLARDHGGDVTGKRNADGSLSPYELNLNYFDAVNDPRASAPADLQVRRFLLSQAIPLAFIGIPGIYLHSLLGSRNDDAGVRATGRARSINRARLPVAPLGRELDDAGSLRHAVFEEYARRLRLRRAQPAFHPDADQDVLDLGPRVFAVRRRNAATGDALVALHNVSAEALAVGVPGARGRLYDRLADGAAVPADACPLAPYQVRWLAE